MGTGKILSVRNSVVDPYTVQIFSAILMLVKVEVILATGVQSQIPNFARIVARTLFLAFACELSQFCTHARCFWPLCIFYLNLSRLFHIVFGLCVCFIYNLDARKLFWPLQVYNLNSAHESVMSSWISSELCMYSRTRYVFYRHCMHFLWLLHVRFCLFSRVHATVVQYVGRSVGRSVITFFFIAFSVLFKPKS